MDERRDERTREMRGIYFVYSTVYDSIHSDQRKVSVERGVPPRAEHMRFSVLGDGRMAMMNEASLSSSRSDGCTLVPWYSLYSR